jgi:hypothetical protein
VPGDLGRGKASYPEIRRLGNRSSLVAQRSLKGAVKKNISPPTGHRDEVVFVAASHSSVETIS